MGIADTHGQQQAKPIKIILHVAVSVVLVSSGLGLESELLSFCCVSTCNYIRTG